jgi:hypothetical protein
VKLPLGAFHSLAVIGTIFSLLQHDEHVLKLPPEESHPLAVIGESVSYVRHFGHVAIYLDFEMHRAEKPIYKHF